MFKKWREQRQLRQEVLVFGCLLIGDQFVTDIIDRVGGSSGWVYPALQRLQQRGLVGACIVDHEGRPRTAYSLIKETQ